MRSFHSTVECPAPCYLYNCCEKYDIAAVIAGTKPNAMIHLPEDDVTRALIDLARKNDIDVIIDDDKLYVGKIEEIEDLKRCMRLHTENDEELIARSSKIGKILGYCDEAIHDFVEYGIKRKMTFHERTLRRKLVRTP
jgi:hypothetical protein